MAGVVYQTEMRRAFNQALYATRRQSHQVPLQFVEDASRVFACTADDDNQRHVMQVTDAAGLSQDIWELAVERWQVVSKFV